MIRISLIKYDIIFLQIINIKFVFFDFINIECYNEKKEVFIMNDNILESLVAEGNKYIIPELQEQWKNFCFNRINMNKVSVVFAMLVCMEGLKKDVSVTDIFTYVLKDSRLSKYRDEILEMYDDFVLPSVAKYHPNGFEILLQCACDFYNHEYSSDEGLDFMIEVVRKNAAYNSQSQNIFSELKELGMKFVDEEKMKVWCQFCDENSMSLDIIEAMVVYMKCLKSNIESKDIKNVVSTCTRFDFKNIEENFDKIKDFSVGFCSTGRKNNISRKI